MAYYKFKEKRFLNIYHRIEKGLLHFHYEISL